MLAKKMYLLVPFNVAFPCRFNLFFFENKLDSLFYVQKYNEILQNCYEDIQVDNTFMQNFTEYL